MLKDFAWNIFKKTGNINTFLEFKDIEQSSNNSNINQNNNCNENIGGLFGNNKNKGNSN